MAPSKDTQSSTNPPPDEGVKQPYETFTGSLKGWQLAALKASTRWPDGFEVTREGFDAALKAALDEEIT